MIGSCADYPYNCPALPATRRISQRLPVLGPMTVELAHATQPNAPPTRPTKPPSQSSNSGIQSSTLLQPTQAICVLIALEGMCVGCAAVVHTGLRSTCVCGSKSLTYISAHVMPITHAHIMARPQNVVYSTPVCTAPVSVASEVGRPDLQGVERVALAAVLLPVLHSLEYGPCSGPREPKNVGCSTVGPQR